MLGMFMMGALLLLCLALAGVAENPPKIRRNVRLPGRYDGHRLVEPGRVFGPGQEAELAKALKPQQIKDLTDRRALEGDWQGQANAQSTSTPSPEQQELEQARQRIDELEAQLQSGSETGGQQTDTPAGGTPAPPPSNDDRIRAAAKEAGLNAQSSDNDLLKTLKHLGVAKPDLAKVREIIKAG